MKKSRFQFDFIRWYPVYDDTDDTDDDDDKLKEEQEKDKKDSEKRFSQKEVDLLINKRFKKERQEKEKLLKRLEAIETDGLTPESKEELQSQIDSLKESLEDKEKTNAQRLQEAEKKHAKTLADITSERDTWKDRYHRSRIERDMFDAASASEAESPEQLVLMFGNSARLVEETDAAGKGTGNFVTKVKIKGIDPESKKPVDLDLPPGEAFSHMREHGLHKNLFKHKSADGTGVSGTGTSGGNNGKSEEPKRESFKSEEDYSQAYQSYRDSHDLDGNPLQKA